MNGSDPSSLGTSIQTGEVDDLAITTPKIAANAVTAAKIAATTITNAEISATAAIAATKIAGTAAVLGANTFTGDQNIGANNLKTTNYNIVQTTIAGSEALLHQTSAANTLSMLSVASSGTNTTPYINLFRTSSLVNYEALHLTADATVTGEFNILVNKGGTGTLRPLNFVMGSTSVLQLNTTSPYVQFQESTANGTVAVTFTNLGPSGVGANVAEWIKIKRPSGTTGYIPVWS